MHFFSIGAVYIYVQKDVEVWSVSLKLWPQDGSGGHKFGHSISLYHNTLVVGALTGGVKRGHN